MAQVRRLTGDPEGLGKIAKDQFGNYVIQSILSSYSPDQARREGSKHSRAVVCNTAGDHVTL